MKAEIGSSEIGHGLVRDQQYFWWYSANGDASILRLVSEDPYLLYKLPGRQLESWRLIQIQAPWGLRSTSCSRFCISRCFGTFTINLAPKTSIEVGRNEREKTEQQ